MPITADNLPDDLTALKRIIATMTQDALTAQAEIARLKFQLARYGRDDKDWNACPCCGGRMIIVEAFEPGCQPRFWPVPSIGLDSS